jgi:hypothetical protein
MNRNALTKRLLLEKHQESKLKYRVRLLDINGEIPVSN